MDLRQTRFRLLLFSTLMVVALWAQTAWAAKTGGYAHSGTSQLMRSASVVGPLGISPFFALAGFGIAAAFGIFELPPGLESLGHPLVWGLALVVAIFLHVGRSTKLTKPFAEALGTGESLFALATAAALMLPHFSSPAPAMEAGVGTGILMLSAGLSSVAALIILRTALDIMIWLSPIPFVDGLFQGAKLILTIGLIAIAVLSPPVAVVLNIGILIGTFFLVRWAVRTARFGLTLAHDLTIGKFKSQLSMPKDSVVEEDIGPFEAFVLQHPAAKKRTPVQVEMRAGRWFLLLKPEDEKAIPLGDGPELTLTPGWLGTEMQFDDRTLLLPARYNHLTEQLAQQTRAEIGKKPKLVQPKRMRQAQAV